MVRTSLILIALLYTSAPALGQTADPPPPAHEQIVSANPFGLIFGWFNVEYERVFTPAATWGVSGSMFDWDDFEYRNANLLARYYPQENAPEGVFLGGRMGVYHVASDDAADRDATFAGAGFEIGYTWLLGRRERIAISIGGGANRLFAGDLEDAPLVLPTARLVNVGVAF